MFSIPWQFPKNVGTAWIGALGARAERWARKRQGPDPASTHLHAPRIYILPTRAGFIFAFIVFTMLLGAMNYNNNMGFALTFLLAGIGVVSIHHCHRNLADLYLHFLGGHPVFAGEPMVLRFVVENRVTEADGIKDFATGGYAYDPDLSEGDKWVFLRDYPT